jgi:hypothetical protein
MGCRHRRECASVIFYVVAAKRHQVIQNGVEDTAMMVSTAQSLGKQ